MHFVRPNRHRTLIGFAGIRARGRVLSSPKKVLHTLAHAPRACDLGANSLHRLPEMLVLQRTVQPQQSRQYPAVRMASPLFPFLDRTP